MLTQPSPGPGHDARVRLRLLSVVPVVLAMVLVAGCSDDDKSSSSSSSGSSALPSDDDLATYFGAVASYDVDQLAAAEGIAADGSPAQDYLRYQQAYATASTAGGNPLPSAEAEPFDGGFKACQDAGEGEECATWADLQGKDGRLSGFTVNGSDIKDSLVSLEDQPPIDVEGLFSVQPAFAYLSPPLHVLFVLVDVTATDLPLEVLSRRAVYVDQVTVLSGADSRGPTTVDPGQSQTVILAFPDAEGTALDGQVTFDVTVGGTDHQSVGFGLADPAAG